MHYLVTEFKYFVDPHGSADLGGERKFITDNPDYLEMVHDDDDMFYDGDGEFVHGDDLRGSEDGYNRRTYQYTVKELKTQHEVDVASDIIKEYNKL